MVLAGIFLLLALVLLRRFETGALTYADAILAGMSGIFGYLLYHFRKHYRFIAGLLFVAVGFCSVCLLSWIGKGLYDSSVFAFLAVILISSLLLNMRVTIVFLILTLIWLWTLAILQHKGLVIYSGIDPPLGYVRDITITLFIVSAIGHFYLKGVNRYMAIVSNELNVRIRTENALRESEEKFRALFHQAAEGILIGNSKGEILLVNEAMEELTGYSQVELQGNKMNMLFQDGDLQEKTLPFNFPEDSQVVSAMRKIRRKKGDGLMIEMRSKKMSDGRLQTFFSDITERIQAERSLKDFERIFNLSANPICITNVEGNLLKINPSFAAKLGYKKGEIEGRNITDFMHPDDHQRTFDYISREMKRKSKLLNIENRYIAKNGEIIWFSWSTQPIYDEGIGFSVAHDITRLKIIESELIEAKEKAEESDRLKTAFLANMSHEIRTPMNGIIGFSEMFISSDLTQEERIHYGKIIHNSGLKLLTVLDDIINISRIETGELELYFEPVNVILLLGEVYDLFLARAYESGITFSFENDLDDEHARVITDKGRLHQVISNLISNALKFTKKGSVSFGCVLKEENLEFFVEDTGIGIAPEASRLIFERFQQADHSISKEFGGTGLGLAISQKLAELLGGKIWVVSKPGEGSIFYFTIPFKPAPETDREDRVAVRMNNKVKNQKKLALLVEDDDANLEFLDTLLKRQGLDTIHARNGKEAVEVVKAHTAIDLVFMDIKMPLMNGLDATRIIKSIRPQLYIVAQTAFAMQADREKALKAGCDSYISKPIVAEALQEVLNKFLES
jgi:PAS domain S-box-containing protein